MNRKRVLTIGVTAAALAGLGRVAISAQDKYTVKVPGGVAFSEFKGYEKWQVVSISHNDKVMAVILGNPKMIDAYKAGVPENGKPFPDGAKLAKIHWKQTQSTTAPSPTTVPGVQTNADFMEKDSKRFADSGGWGWGAFEYDATARTFRPGTTSDVPPQANDAKCGLQCHTRVKTRDFVFTEYATR
jgi:hypothetical protein